jgi:cell division protein ZapE
LLHRLPPPLLARYEALISAGAVERDPAQVEALDRLAKLETALAEHRQPSLSERALSLFTRAAPRPAPRGLYIWGPVGRGKTTVMDLFFDTLDVERKRRTHFHAFMADVHDRLHHARQNRNGGDDPVSRVAGDLARETRVLCFDEFSVGDIADATILARLFSALLADGVVVVATSNVAPQRLYEGGRNRDLFLPFIALLEHRLDIIHLDAGADYRLDKKCGGDVYFSPADTRAANAIDALFDAAAGGSPAEPMMLEVKRRALFIPRAAGRVARFSFADICGKPLGAGDYAALAARFDKIVVEHVPQLGFERRNEARRLITLVDVLYDAKCKLVISAAAQPADLYLADHGSEAREFARTVSRLSEMRSHEYLAAARG